MSKFEIGDLVKIGTVKGSAHSVESMYEFEGRVGRITQRHPDAEYQNLVRIEDTDDWWFDENILTLADNREFIDAFLEGKDVEFLDINGRWVTITAITPSLKNQTMRFAKSDEVKAIEKEIESIRAEIETLAKQKKDIDLRIKNEKARISRREKKIKALS